jgi:hypothetical protein
VLAAALIAFLTQRDLRRGVAEIDSWAGSGSSRASKRSPRAT